MKTGSKSPSVRNGITKLALAGALIVIPTAAVSVPAYAAPGGPSNAPANYGALPAPPPADPPSPAPPPPAPPAPVQYNTSDDYYCGGCDGGGGGGG